ncbi:Cytidylyltransferase family protein [Trichomonas vaginalis G3]|uniref:Nicotinamide-nucleotide adenylyltransferase n=1 Tax=Trichomonas vaginalis (strain ATCC PRA-98 / G3) TaxID=412133 RepID=A2D8B1_TRIV3|nr:nicotinate-nucleotide adenylyltransferase protein [Trichomonas vaginalis G3]EAY23544.1 Cytidylyltransferase family protein [Trichomonas vaginalis G3]KAI5493966.1 nicotinate-nucleotide adenylyltransferase protein [Trichomonas vaginalis G3]|eukprot:XP_001584530.1 Cytidylyltransferase family protein [Trichomonas vaginalis G3]
MTSEEIVLAFCGSFNPPTNGHLMAATIARDHMTDLGFNVKATVFVPAHSGYIFKPGILSGEQRAEMLEAMVAHTDYLSVDRFEVQKNDWTRTIDTLLYLREKHKCRIVLIVGIDIVESFETKWREPDVKRILEEFGLCILPRVTEAVDLKSKCKYIEGRDKLLYVVGSNPLNLVSSTLVRDEIKKGHHIVGLVDPAVAEIIAKNNYYKD